jgi:lipopolysaccharide assembly outer membrane protein LptD (OstA)
MADSVDMRATPPTVTATGLAVNAPTMTLTGNVSIEVNGAIVLADRAVLKEGEFRLEGNVRLKVPTL